jgi:hypothetical protein
MPFDEETLPKAAGSTVSIAGFGLRENDPAGSGI